jgi:hypothetical protein
MSPIGQIDPQELAHVSPHILVHHDPLPCHGTTGAVAYAFNFQNRKMTTAS